MGTLACLEKGIVIILNIVHTVVTGAYSYVVWEISGVGPRREPRNWRFPDFSKRRRFHEPSIQQRDCCVIHDTF